MFKKILILTFFWTIFIIFFYLLFAIPAPKGSTYEINNSTIEVVLKFIGMFVFSSMVVGYISMSYQFLKDKK